MKLSYSDTIRVKCLFLLVIIFIFIANYACTPEPKLSPMQIRQITTRMFDSDYETVYRAALTVIQDQGYIIKNTDMASGLILAGIDKESSTGKQLFQALMFGYIADKGTEFELSCMVNKLSENSTEIRLNIQKTKYGQFSALSGVSKTQTEQIYDADLFNKLFNEIALEVKRREALK